MQAIIMAAGKGSRIEELTGRHPKSFLEVGGKKLIERNIDMIHAHEITDIIIVTGYHDWEFEELFKGSNDIKLVYNPFYEMTNVIGSFFMGMDTLHEDFIYLHADTICEDSIFADLMEMDGDIVLPVDTKPCDDEAMKVCVADGRVCDITKEMPTDMAYGEFIGIAKIRKSILSELRAVTVDIMRRKEFSGYFEAALQNLLKHDQYDFKILDVTGRYWAEIDFPEDYIRAIGLNR